MSKWLLGTLNVGQFIELRSPNTARRACLTSFSVSIMTYIDLGVHRVGLCRPDAVRRLVTLFRSTTCTAEVHKSRAQVVISQKMHVYAP